MLELLPLLTAGASFVSTDGEVEASELTGFKELVPDAGWSKEDFVKRFGHHLPEENHQVIPADFPHISFIF